jgi:signal transduction histidine kinase/DNA-binding response OmpR family regulator/ligand-binding sensor domain-containing protein
MKYLRIVILLMVISLLSACKKNNSDVIPEDYYNTSTLTNQHVNDIAEDKFGQIWIATDGGLSKYVAKRFANYFYDKNDTTSLPSDKVCCLFRDSKDRFWAGTNDGLCLYTDRDCFHRINSVSKNAAVSCICQNRKGQIYVVMGTRLCRYDDQYDVLQDIASVPENHSNNIMNIYCDYKNRLWIVCAKRLFCYQGKRMIARIELKAVNRNTSVAFDSKGRIWMVIDGKLKLLDTHVGKFVGLPKVFTENKFLHDIGYSNVSIIDANTISLFTAGGFASYSWRDNKVILPAGYTEFKKEVVYIKKIFVDSKKNIWMASNNHGFFLRQRNDKRFNNNNVIDEPLEGKSIISIMGNRKGNIYFTTVSDGFLKYNADSKQMNVLHASIPFQGFVNIIVYVDHNGYVWIADNHRYLYKCADNGNNLQILKKYEAPFILLSFIEIPNGDIYFAGYNTEVYRIRKNSENSEKLSFYSGKLVVLPTMMCLSDGTLLLGACEHDLLIYNSNSNRVKRIPFKHFMVNGELTTNCALEDNHHNIWIGTLGQGLYLMTPDHRIRKMKGVPCSDICSILQSGNGDIWISTSNGLSCYSKKNKRFSNYNETDGIGGNMFYDRSLFKSSDGTLFFGGGHGVTTINPKDWAKNDKPKLVFESLKIDNVNMKPSDGCIEKALNYNPIIYLKYNQRSFFISYAVIDYSKYSNYHYQYKIDGYDKNWVYDESDNGAYYSNMPSGNYTFRVRVTGNDSQTVLAETSIRLHVEQTVWLQWWAILIYLILLFFIIDIVFDTNHRMFEQREAIARAKREKEDEERINKMNMSFFTNISHEFRTPLTMISGPVRTLLIDKRLNGDAKQLLQIVEHSIDRMLRLVNQMLDFQKLESDAIRLEVADVDVVPCIKNITSIFSLNAEQKDIALTVSGADGPFRAWIDVDKLEKILTNFLSNAMKFTPAGGQIEVSLKSDGKGMLELSVSDTGPGIPEESQKDIFRRYYQVGNHKLYRNYGTGIGLYYAMRLAELHKGTILVANRPQGGSVFTLRVPMAENAYLEAEKKSATAIAEQQSVTSSVVTDVHLDMYRPDENTSESRFKVLVIDDDEEIVNYIRTYLTRHFEVVCKYDAKSAYENLESISPDLILCDIMMPGIDGLQFCRMLKQNIDYSHIPIILLTAKSLLNDQIQGLRDGANAYVTKPFQPEYLIALIQAQLRNIQSLRNMLVKATDTSKINSDVISNCDNKFMENLYKLMNDNISDVELNITRITETMHISRTKFYYKVKSLTGETPISFFNNFKLNKAAELLKDGRYNISEVSNITGFSTPSYFASCFKKRFGVTPSEFIE